MRRVRFPAACQSWCCGMTVSAPLGTRLPCLPLRSPSHDRVPSSPASQRPAAPSWLCPNYRRRVGGSQGHAAPLMSLLPLALSLACEGARVGRGGGKGKHLGLPGTPPRWLCVGQMDGWRQDAAGRGSRGQEGFFFLFREGCNLIGGHSCVNRGIEEFCVGLMELTLHEWPPSSSSPEMGHFPHVSENMTTSPAKSWKWKTSQGEASLFFPEL